MLRRILPALLLCAVAGGPARALTVERLETHFEHGVYRVSLQALLAAPASAVAAVLRDYDDYPSLDPRIRSSERLDAAPGDAVFIRTVVHACAGFFCRNVERVERIEQSPGELVATVIPGRSEVRRGITRTRWQASGEATEVTYEAEFEPDFWVPAIIARKFAMDTLRASTLQLFGNVESRAHGR
ncbi:MAG: hypothetical protein FIB04_02105 [Gammaproteobacteria bacterium]|nr:hypothetical protein [Gammaproteobacteria bacterium]